MGEFEHMKEQAQAKFQQLLRELFRFDSAELDFGIYRIMNHKRRVIERFINEVLPQVIENELTQDALAEQAHAREMLESAKQKVLDMLGEDALDVDGNLAEPYHNTKVGREYLEARAKANHARTREALEAEIYNHLYAFFSRYYDDGDFLSKRRYSKNERYAIPYNGEEVFLYWANYDQYYIKTAERFTDYTWKAPNGVTVRFKLKAANTEQNNVKGAKRFFLLQQDAVVWNEGRRELVIHFEYRPLTEEETKTYGNKNQQENIIAEALTIIHQTLGKNFDALAALFAERRKDPDGNPISHLEHHLQQYTARNTQDFFIHKDLKGFLSRELDFYMKNEVLNLEEMEAAGEELAEGWFQLLRVIRKVGRRIIDFLAQIEDFQKMLWEKKKFVTETFYFITVGTIPENFYPEIAENAAQWEEWKTLFHIDELPTDLLSGDTTTPEGRIAFLKAHPTLMLDTRNFSSDFVDRLLASFEGLDEKTDGLLVHSENWQALNLMQEKYKGRVQCIHIDPPYNTQTSGFLYKNDYPHSSWLTMMENRIAAGISLLTNEGSFLCHIDENEYERLHLLFEEMGLPNAGTVVWDKRNPMTAGRGVANQHEYVIWRSNTNKPIYMRSATIEMMLNKAKELISKHGGVTEEVRTAYAEWVRNNPKLSGGEKAYRYIDDEGNIYQSVSLRAPEPRTDPKFFQPLIHPVTGKPCPVPPNGFSRTPEKLQQMAKRGEILFGPDETTQPRQKRILTYDSRRQVTSVIQDARRGKADLDALGMENFPYNHAVPFYMELIGAAAHENTDIVLDFFAGSGTTGHAVINLNREDGVRRKFILVEMGEYFDTVLLPRIKKVSFTPEWKDGMPTRMPTEEEAEHGPRIVKVIRLESYEDALNNITFSEEDTQLALQFEDYLLRYMLKWEARQSETLLDVEKLQSPFSYCLNLYRDGENRVHSVDLPETFHYLIGLEIKTRRVFEDNGRRYLVYRGVTRDGRETAVIWRETQGWVQKDYERDRDFVIRQNLAAGADDVFVNGDSLIPGARSLDGVFKTRMFTPVEV
jgi:adenine-specific DNA-methyltransferase